MPKKPRYTFLITNQPAGDYTLPEPVNDAYAELDRLLDHSVPQPEEADRIGHAAAELRRAARTPGATLLTRVPGFLKAEAEQRETRAASEALVRATADATQDWEAIVVEHLDAIMRAHLAPVHADLVAEARELWPLIGHILTPAEAVAADDKTRAAYLRFNDLAVQFNVLRDTAARTNEASDTHIQHPAHARHYAILRNPADCWDDFTRLQHQVLADAVGPWHGDARHQLAWLAAHPVAEAWLPTNAERNQLIEERHGARIEAHRRGLAGGRAVQAWAGV